MFGTIRKHQTWLWGIIITLTISSFVIFFSPYTKMNANVRERSHGTINGKNISNQDYIQAYKEVNLHHFITTGRWSDEEKKQGFDPEREAYTWLLIVQKQDELGIRVSDEAAEQFGRNIIRSFEGRGVSSPQIFFQQVLGAKGFTPEDFERFVHHFVGIQELISTVGIGGEMIPPDQAREFYERDHQELAVEAALFPFTNYEAAVQITPESLGQFYSNMVANYRIPERLQVDYVRFGLSNYLAQAQAELTNLNEIVDMNFQRLGTNAVPGANSEQEAKDKIREQILKQKALMSARTKAMEFANTLFAMNPLKPENLRDLAASNNIPVQVSQPFDRSSGPKDIEGGPDFAKAAFAMTPDEPFSSPVIGQDGVYIMAFDKKLPEVTPSLDDIREKVTSDYKRIQARRTAQQSAMAFSQTATNALAQGKSFTNICAEAHATPITIPPFSISTRSLKDIEELIPLTQLKQAAFGTPPGKVSGPIPASEGAMVIYVKEKLPFDSSKEQSDLPAFVAQLRRTRQQESFDEWLRREADRGLRGTPIAKPQNPPVMGTKTAAK